MGPVFTSSAHSAFITGLNVVGVFVLQPGSWRRLWPQALLAAAGTVSAVTEPSLLTVNWSGDIAFALLLTAGGATVFAFWVQTHFQRYSTPVRTGLIFVCEPPFAALFAVGFYGEILRAEAWLGRY